MIRIEKGEEFWEVKREDILLTWDEHRDIAFLEACNLVEDSEEIVVYDDFDEVEFKFDIWV